RVWKAGLFHSVYGTEYFDDALLPISSRERLAAQIGDDAERLGYLFCAFRRASLHRALDLGPPYELELRMGGRCLVSRQELTDLACLLWANTLEQSPFPTGQRDATISARQSVARCDHLLPAPALAELSDRYADPIRPGLRTLFGFGRPMHFHPLF